MKILSEHYFFFGNCVTLLDFVVRPYFLREMIISPLEMFLFWGRGPIAHIDVKREAMQLLSLNDLRDNFKINRRLTGGSIWAVLIALIMTTTLKWTESLVNCLLNFEVAFNFLFICVFITGKTNKVAQIKPMHASTCEPIIFFQFSHHLQAYQLFNEVRFSTAALVVTIEDVNDNCPVFDNPTYDSIVTVEDLFVMNNETMERMLITATDGDLDLVSRKGGRWLGMKSSTFSICVHLNANLKTILKFLTRL